MSLAERVCVVTGGGRGIGGAIGRRFHQGGGTVAVWDLDGDAAAAAATAISGSAHACDVSRRADVEAATEATLARHGRIDVLVNNAGVAIAGPPETYTDADWDMSIGIMQTGVFLCSQVVGRLAYCAAKAAVVAMTEVLAFEWADRGIRVNAVAPGLTRTAPVQRGIDEGVVDVERYRARTPMRRFGEPDEIARAVAYLADDEQASFITGETLCVDGGWSAQGWIVA